MHILIVNNTQIPALKYGGTERVIWWLGKQLVQSGHKVSYLVAKGSTCPFADVYEYTTEIPFNKLVPETVDVIHLQHRVNEIPLKPYIITMHGNMNEQVELDLNTVFVSKNHANRFGSDSFVYNGIDFDDYGKPELSNKRNYIHFLGDAAWRVKNVRGAIDIAKKAHTPIKIIGGKRFNFNQGIRLTFDPNAHFCGMVGGVEKNNLLQNSNALLFPVLWNEPFGLAIVESLYFGCPVFGTPYGSLPELVSPEVGFLSNQKSSLVEAVKNLTQFSRKTCHEYAVENFSSGKMAKQYVQCYEKVLNGISINYVNPMLNQIQPQKFLPFYS